MRFIKQLEEIKGLPTELYIEPTNRCNSKCNICVRTFQSPEPPKDISFEESKSIVDQFPRLERVVLHGIGEPLLNKEVFRMVDYLKSKGSKVLFNSNAILLKRKLIQRKLIHSGLDEYRISIDAATEETYRKMRGVSAFNKVIDSIKHFVKLKKSLKATSPKVSLWFVGTKENITELPDLIRIAGEIGIQEVYLQRLTFLDGHKASGLAREENSIYQNPYHRVLKIIEKCEELAESLDIKFASSGATTPMESLGALKKESHPWQKCHRPWTLSYITANGNVLPCCISPFSTSEYGELILGNVFEDDFISIWNNAKYKTLRRRLLSPNPPRYCKGCGEKWSL